MQVNTAFDRTGASFNAGTGWENTSYYASVLPEYLGQIAELWSELMRPALRKEDFDIEKNVIKEEIAMYMDMPAFDVMDRCQSLYFSDHPCGNSILGTEESIDNLTVEQMRNYFVSRYAPNNMTLVVVGNFDWQQICSIARAMCSPWQSGSAGRKISDFRGTEKKGRLEKANLLHEHICLMSPACSANSPQKFAASLLSTIVGDHVGSRFYWELVDNALAESASMQFGPMDGTGVFYSCLSCSPEQKTRVMATVNKIFRSLIEKGVTEEEMQTAKNKTLSELVIQNELPKGRLVSVGSNWIYCGEYRTVEDDIRAIKAVTTDEIMSFIQAYNPAKFTQFSIGPAGLSE
jgi:predicted Zn-dependent peptidase